MRYWGYLAAKLVVAAAPLYIALLLIVRRYPGSSDPNLIIFTTDKRLLCDLALMVWFIITVGVVYMILWDQRRRCRVCLHRLRMPIETGSWSYLLQVGRPTIESICPYGHGTLKEDELQIDGLRAPEWKPNSKDPWDELVSSIVKDKRKDS